MSGDRPLYVRHRGEKFKVVAAKALALQEFSVMARRA
jgi:hypothetical protein